LTDAIVTLHYLFRGGPPPACTKSADANDTGVVDLTDAVYLLNYLFRSGPAPAEPFASCGEDPRADELSCDSYPPCE
jgi:hypothetical protein